MKSFQKQFEISIENREESKNRVFEYFKFYDFLFEETSEGFLFYKKNKMINEWKFNPLSWETKCVVKFEETKIIINYSNFGNVTFSPLLFQNLFDSFLTNLKHYILEDLNYNSSNQKAINKAKLSIYKYFFIIIICIILGGIAGSFVGKYLGGERFFVAILMFLSALLSLEIINKQTEAKNQSS